MNHPHPFNDEDSNTSDNAHFDQVLGARLTRRGLVRGAAAAAGLGALSSAGLSGCATAASPAAPPASLGFQAVPKGVADAVGRERIAVLMRGAVADGVPLRQAVDGLLETDLDTQVRVQAKTLQRMLGERRDAQSANGGGEGSSTSS